MQIDEKQIVTMLHQNDKRVMAIIYDQYAPTLYGVVFRIVQSEAIAEDVMQDAFVKIWKNGMTYNAQKGSLFTWMLNISRNTAIDKIRSAGYRKSEKNQRINSDVYSLASKSNNIVPEEIGLRDLLENLDNKYKEILNLIYFKGFTQQEVSEELNIPLGTVKTRLRTALRNLRELFDVTNLTVLILFFNSLALL